MVCVVSVTEALASSTMTALASRATGPFQYSDTVTIEHATSVQPATSTAYYAAPYSDLRYLGPNVSTTTWGNWLPRDTNTPDDHEDPYGQAAWSAKWENANPVNFTWGTYSSTVSPTPVPSTELVKPPKDPFEFTAADGLTFPHDFVFGVAGSASQIEGAVADEGRTPSIQEFIISDDRPKDYVTNENYYLYKQDIARLAAIGVEYYSFTIPYSRILPFVEPGSPVNQQGIDHYNDLINTVLQHGMKPVVTLTHFDTPLDFVGKDHVTGDYDLSGQSCGYDNETFVESFINYGKIVLTHYADRVPIWVSFNEPYLYAANALGVKHVLQAHAHLYHFYKDELKANGKFGIKFNDNFGVPYDSSNHTDVEAAKRLQEFQLESFGNPIFLGSDYPDSWTDTFGDMYDIALSDSDLGYIGNTSDFFGIDPYTITICRAPAGGIDACASNQSHPLWPLCIEQSQVDRSGWKIGYRSQSYVYITPDGLRQYLNYLYDTFKQPVLIGEFGFPVYAESTKAIPDQVYDTPRSIYYQSYMQAMLQAIHLDNVKMLGAFAWSFVDNWEFGDYAQQFGLQVVERPSQVRHYKKSFFDIMDYFHAHS